MRRVCRWKGRKQAKLHMAANRLDSGRSESQDHASGFCDADRQALLGALERIRRSRTFANSQGLVRFLDFVVGTTLKGEKADLKETLIGVRLYGREPSYDPKLDGIVRTQARRVRERLNEYYRTEAANDPVRLVIPKGGYGPILEPVAAEFPAASPTLTPQANRRPSSSQTPWILSLALSAAALLIGVSVYFWNARAFPAPRARGYRQITWDGQPKSIVYANRERLFVQTGNYASPGFAELPTAGGELKPIPLPVPGLAPLDISPDGSEVLLADYYPGRMWTMQLPSGTLRRLGAVSGTAASWSPDGSRLAYCRGNVLHVSDANGMQTRNVASTPTGGVSAPHWSPDGGKIVYSAWDLSPESPSLWEVSADGSGSRALLPGWHDPPDEDFARWMPDGRFLLFQSQGQIWAKPENAPGAPVRLTDSPLNLATPVPSADGKSIFVVGRDFRGSLVRFDTGSNAFRPFLDGISAEYVTFSPDGERVAYVTYPKEELWLSRKDGGSRRKLTEAPLRPVLPRWSPDGKWIAFAVMIPGRPYKTFLVRADGSTPEMLNTKGPDFATDPSWFPDGNRLALSTYRGQMQCRILLFDRMNGSQSPIEGSQGTYSPAVSPDGRYLVAIRKEPIGLTIYDFQMKTWDELARVNGGFPNWSRDGKYVYFLRFPDNPAVVRIRISDHRLETVADLHDLPLTGRMGSWLGLGPHDEPLLLRDAGRQDVYAVDLEGH